MKPLLGKSNGPANGKGDRSAPMLVRIFTSMLRKKSNCLNCKKNKKGKAANGEGFTRKPRNG